MLDIIAAPLTINIFIQIGKIYSRRTQFLLYKSPSYTQHEHSTLKMVFNKLILLASIAMIEILAINAGKITDWCPPCKRLIDDFTPELKSTLFQDVSSKQKFSANLNFLDF
jgi:hypothetical protein